MENIKMEDIVEKPSPTSEEAQVETAVKPEVETEQDPLKTELEKVQKKSKYTELEKAEHALKSTAERLKILGGDPNTILRIEKETPDIDEDDTPLTVGMLKKLQQENASKSALEEADEINNETERELVKFHLQNTIKSTGSPKEDLKLARALVNAVKNTQIIEEVNRKTPPKTYSNSSGAPAKQEVEVTYSQAELDMMKPPFNITPAQILAAREGKKYSFKNSNKV